MLDERDPPALAESLRDKGHDVIAVATSADLDGSDDATILDAATAEGRCLVTENVRDFTVPAKHTTHAAVLPALADALPDTISADRLPGSGEISRLT